MARSVLPAPPPKFRPLAKKIEKITFFCLTVPVPGDGQVREMLPVPPKFRPLAKKIEKNRQECSDL
jgi:hypothetical protein